MDPSIARSYYRVPEPRGAVLLDASALQGLSAKVIRNVAEQGRLAIPDCLFIEVLTKPEQELCVKLLSKLVNVGSIIVRALADHLEWELINHEPAGLLLHHEKTPGMPEKTGPIVVADILRQLRDGRTPSSLLGDFESTVERKSVRHWQDHQQSMIDALKDDPSIVQARKEGKAALIKAIASNHETIYPMMRDASSEFAAALHEISPVQDKHSMATLPPMNRDWAIYRQCLAMFVYNWINAVDNPPHFSHDRLNQHVDIHYVSLLYPGMALLTLDDELQDMASVVAPFARVTENPDEIIE